MESSRIAKVAKGTSKTTSEAEVMLDQHEFCLEHTSDTASNDIRQPITRDYQLFQGKRLGASAV